MLTPEEAETLGRQLENLKCTDHSSGDGLFSYVFDGEPKDQAHHYEKHFLECEYCRVALELYRYKKDVAKLLGKR